MNKNCPKCGKEKTLEMFFASLTSKDRRQSYCKECKKELQKTPSSRASKKKYKDKFRKPAIPKLSKEEIRSRKNACQAMYEKSDSAKIVKEKYYKSEKFKLSNLNRANKRRSMVNSENSLTVSDWKNILSEYNHSCVYCGSKKRLTQDHIVPVSKGGTHVKDNVVPACQSCNSSKNNKTLIFWMLQKVGL